MKIWSMAAFALVLMAQATTANAQRLDSDDCRNALYHLEDAIVNPTYFARIAANAPAGSICERDRSQRSCKSGRTAGQELVNQVRQANVVGMHMARFSLVPEYISQTGAACASEGNGVYRLGVAFERNNVFSNGAIATDVYSGTFTVRLNNRGNAQILAYDITYHMQPDGVAPRYDLFGRRQYSFDRTYGTRRTVFAARNLGFSASGSASASASGGSSRAGQVENVTGSGTSGLMSSSTAASSQAQQEAEANARQACLSSGGRVLGVSSRPTDSYQATNSTYRSSYTATARCQY